MSGRWSMPISAGMELGLRTNNTGLIVDGICGKLMGTPRMLGKHDSSDQAWCVSRGSQRWCFECQDSWFVGNNFMQIWPWTRVTVSYWTIDYWSLTLLVPLIHRFRSLHFSLNCRFGQKVWVVPQNGWPVQLKLLYFQAFCFFQGGISCTQKSERKAAT